MGLDFNSNTKYDVLRVNFDADIDSAGVYTITGHLAGNAKTEGLYYTTSTIPLTTGLQTISLDFVGTAISGQEINGPYTLTKIAMLDDEYNKLDEVNTDYQTSFYNWTDFEDFRISLDYLNMFEVDVVDVDSDGLYDLLLVNLDISCSRDAVVVGTADLYDKSGRRIINGDGLAFVSENTPSTLSLSFDARYIYGSLKDGPYFIRNVFFYPTADISRGVNIDSLGSIQGYNYTDFNDNVAVISGVVSHPYQSGEFASGTQVMSQETVDYVDNDGFYRLIFFNDGVKEFQLLNPEYPSALWEVYHNNQFIGIQNSAVVDMTLGEIDTVNFLSSTIDQQIISIPTGWSGISSYRIPENPQLETIFADQIANSTIEILLGKSGIFWPAHNINLIGFAKGIYFIRIVQNRDTILVHKIIIE